MYKIFRQRSPQLAQLFKDECGPLDGRDVQQVPRQDLTGNYQLSIGGILWDHDLPKSSMWAWFGERKTTHQQKVDAQANLYIDKFVRPQVASLGRIVGLMHKIRYAEPPSIEERRIGAFQHVIYTDNVPLRITIEYLLEIPTGDYDRVPMLRSGTRIIVDAFVCEARETCSV